MPRTKNIKTQKIEVKEIVCTMCGKTKKSNKYYQSFNPIHATGRLPYCTQCLKNMCLDSNGNINIEKVKEMLRMIDRPFYYDLFKSSIEQKGDTIGVYMKNLALNHKNDGWKHSVFEPVCNNENKEVDALLENFIDFEITKEMILRWGKNHSIEEYITLENFYNKMKEANRIETPQDEFYLKKLATISLKMDEELESGNYGQAKALGDLFSKYMADSQFRAMDKTDADKTGGIRGFGMIYAEVEKDDFIPPWEYYRKIKGIKQDIVDKTIMHMGNFILRLNKIETMINPPSDTPKLEKDELGDDFDG